MTVVACILLVQSLLRQVMCTYRNGYLRYCLEPRLYEVVLYESMDWARLEATDLSCGQCMQLPFVHTTPCYGSVLFLKWSTIWTVQAK
uniref:Secreted protein n=1 Tax=Rhipicephalus appendiculatus TaxID=34631 RepID=A0A131YBT0_RHIAP